jgi:hypothetical protein
MCNTAVFEGIFRNIHFFLTLTNVNFSFFSSLERFNETFSFVYFLVQEAETEVHIPDFHFEGKTSNILFFI